MPQIRARALSALALALTVCASDGASKKAGPSKPGGLASQTGVASWYGGRWHGGPTASGERYNQWSMTAAHKTLPFGTFVRVTNLHNGKATVVRINNRGPYIKGRVIDLSVQAAREIGMYGRGIASVRLDVVPPKTAVLAASRRAADRDPS